MSWHFSGTAVREARTRRRWTQNELARRAKMHPAQIGHLEQGVVRDPRTSTMIRLAEALRVSIADLFEWRTKETT